MATTTNFGWETPDDTDLVKDGALAMRTLGNAIDASMVDLKGGTTGQVLSKTSNTDMDFTWVTSDDANAIQNAIVDAKGDLITATAADTPARLAVGSNGDTLVADSAATTGLRWQSAYNGNGSVNGAMDFWQRGTSFTGTTTNTYGPDRWIVYRNAAGSTFSRQTSGLDGFLYSTRIQRDSGNTSTAVLYLSQMLESQESYKYAGKTVTLSWYAKAGANFSAASSQMIARIYTGTGTDQNWIQTGYTGQATTLDNLTTITTSWVRYSASVAIPSTTTELSITFGFTPVGTASTNDWVEITGVQLELGSVATTFKRAGGTIQGELAACQRYYIRYASAQLFGKYGLGYAHSTTQASIFLFNPVTMRVKPTSIEFSLLGLTIENTSTTAITALTIIDGSNNQPVNLNATVASGLTTNRPYELSNNASASGYVGLSAEL
jgi:hypothetical protein